MARRIARMVIIACVAGGLMFGAVNRTVSLAAGHPGAGADRRHAAIVHDPSVGQDQTLPTDARHGQGFRVGQSRGSR